MMTFKNIINITIFSYIFGIINCHLGLNEGTRCNTDNLIGLCTQLPECQTMTNLLQSGKMRFRDIVTCSYVRDTPVVCCLDNPQLIETSTHKHHPGNNGGLIFPGPTSESRFVSTYHTIPNTTSEILTTSNRPNIPEKTVFSSELELNVNNLNITDQKEFIDLTKLLNNWQNTSNKSLSKNNSITIITSPLLNNTNFNNRDMNSSQGINVEKISTNNKNESQSSTDYYDIFDTTNDFINVSSSRQTNSLNSTHLDINSLDNSLAETEQTRGSWSWGPTKVDSDINSSTSKGEFVPNNIKSKLSITNNKTRSIDRVENSIADWTNGHNRGGGIRSTMIIVPVDSNMQVGTMHGNVHHTDQGMWNGGSWGGHQRSMQVAPNRGGNFVNPIWRENQGNPSWGLNNLSPSLENSHIDPHWRVEQANTGLGRNPVETSWGSNNIHSSRGHRGWNPAQGNFNQVHIFEGNQIDTTNNNRGNQGWSGNSNTEIGNSNRWPADNSKDRAEKLQINPDNPWLSKNQLTSTTRSSTKKPDIVFPNDERLTSILTKSTPTPTLDPWMQDALNSKLTTTTTTELDPWIKDALNHGRIETTSKPKTPSELDPWIKEALGHQRTTSTTTPKNIVNDPWAPYEPKFPTTTTKSDIQPTLEPWLREALDLSNPSTTVKPNIEHFDLNRLIKGLPNAGSPMSSEDSSRTSSSSVKTPSKSPISDVYILTDASGGRAARSESEYITPVTTTAKPKENIVDKTNANSNLRNSDKACQRYRSVKKGILFNKITDGLPVEEGEFPHMVALGYPSTGFGSDFSWDCGGTLISERYILTAAHCAGRVDPTMVRMGKLSLDSNLDNLTAVDIPVEKIVVHPEYSSFLKYHDVALIRLANDVEFESGRILPACLSNQMSDVTSNTTLWATGWGVVSTNTRSRSAVLLKANLTSYDLMTCNQTHIDYGVTRQYPTGLDNGQLCAGDPEGKKDTCQGDSGGPLQYLDGRNEMSVVIGITSFGASCGTTIPSVYARVAFYLDWIESVAWP